MYVTTNKLIGKSLDWAVAKSIAVESGRAHVDTPAGRLFVQSPLYPSGILDAYNPSTDWAQGGPLLSLENISTSDQHGCRGMEKWLASLYLPDDCGLIMQWGPTHLVAAMRCLVTAKLGDQIDILDELMK